MAIRWRADGKLLCAAKSKPMDGDTYIDDRLHYWLSVVCRALVADIRHEENGLWHWTLGDGPFLRAQPEDYTPDSPRINEYSPNTPAEAQEEGD